MLHKKSPINAKFDQSLGQLPGLNLEQIRRVTTTRAPVLAPIAGCLLLVVSLAAAQMRSRPSTAQAARQEGTQGRSVRAVYRSSYTELQAEPAQCMEANCVE